MSEHLLTIYPNILEKSRKKERLLSLVYKILDSRTNEQENCVS